MEYFSMIKVKMEIIKSNYSCYYGGKPLVEEKLFNLIKKSLHIKDNNIRSKIFYNNWLEGFANVVFFLIMKDSLTENEFHRNFREELEKTEIELNDNNKYYDAFISEFYDSLMKDNYLVKPIDLTKINFHNSSENEYSNCKEQFKAAYYDNKSCIKRILNEQSIFLVSGNKGLGKTAITKKLISLAEDKSDELGREVNLDKLIVRYIDLGAVHYPTFARFIDEKFDAAWRYYDSWMIFYLTYIYEEILKSWEDYEIPAIGEVSLKFKSICDKLKDSGLITSNYLSKLNLNVSQMSIAIKSIQATIDVNKKNTIILPSALAEFLITELFKIQLHQKLVIAIDGTDQLIKSNDYENVMIWDMINAAGKLNTIFFEQFGEMAPKYVIVIRKDILEQLNDSDSNKIIQDCTIDLKWDYNYQSLIPHDLFKIVYKRFAFAAQVNSENEFLDFINHYFMRLSETGYHNKDLSKRIIDNLLKLTAYKPRDILMFFKYCRNSYPKENYLEEKHLTEIKLYYARSYFLIEMCNDLSHMFTEKTIMATRNAIKSILTRQVTDVHEFSLSTWKNAYNRNEDILDLEKEKILKSLYNHGYIGVVKKTNLYYDSPYSSGVSQKKYLFSYNNESLDYDDYDRNDTFVTHYTMTLAYPKD